MRQARRSQAALRNLTASGARNFRRLGLGLNARGRGAGGGGTGGEGG